VKFSNVNAPLSIRKVHPNQLNCAMLVLLKYKMNWI
jgi:hypothetical protein